VRRVVARGSTRASCCWVVLAPQQSWPRRGVGNVLLRASERRNGACVCLCVCVCVYVCVCVSLLCGVLHVVQLVLWCSRRCSACRRMLPFAWRHGMLGQCAVLRQDAPDAAALCCCCQAQQTVWMPTRGLAVCRRCQHLVAGCRCRLPAGVCVCSVWHGEYRVLQTSARTALWA
jgi:hypothetical protein